MSEETCPLCGRLMVDGPSVDDHHLIPVSVKKNNNKIRIHRICHVKIHSLFSEKELGNVYNTIDKLLEHEEMQKFVRWVRKKDSEYYDSSKFHTTRRRKR